MKGALPDSNKLKRHEKQIQHVVLDWILYGGGNAIKNLIEPIGKMEILAEIQVFNVKCPEVDNCTVVR